MQEFFDDIKDNFFGNARLSGLKQLAQSNKYKFKRKESFASQPYQLKGFEIFKGQNTKRLKGIIHIDGKGKDYYIRCYDYIYDGNSGVWKTTVFEMFDTNFSLPMFEIRPKGAVKKMKEFFLEDDRIFPQITEFHTQYEIISDEIDDLRFELNHDVLELIAKHPGLHIEGEGHYLLLYRPNKLVEPQYFFSYYEMLVKLIDTLINGQSDEGFV